MPTPKPVLVSMVLALLLAACALDGPEPRPVALRVLSADERQEAALLATRLRCAACHETALERVAPEAAPSLDRIGARKTPAGLRRWLSDPHAAKPGTAMPDLLAGLAAKERERTIDELVHFLASQGGPIRVEEREVELAELERGRQLYHSVGCVACHSPQESAPDLERTLWSFDPDERIAPQVAADLGNPAFETTVDALAEFLAAPLEARPSGRMPSLGLDSGEARAIATYLLRGRISPEGLQALPGWRWRYFEGVFSRALPGFDGAAAVAEGVLESFDALPPHREDNFGFELSGLIEVEQPGSYTFWTTSDDGSNLFIDGRKVVDNDGVHAPQERSGDVFLERGTHAVTIVMFEQGGGQELSVRWRPPHGEKQPLPAKLLSHGRARMTAAEPGFELDPERAELGRRQFRRLGCASCHAAEGVGIDAPGAAPLSRAAQRLDRGCLADEPSKSAPRFALDAEQRTLLRSLLADAQALAAPRSDAEALEATLARLDCRACHRRGGGGGPNDARAPYFRAAVEADLGNEGRLPPHLDGVGAKLRPEWTARVLLEGAGARPYVATRMPRFGTANVGGLERLFERVDEPADVAPARDFDPELVEAGRKLAGAKGLGCIQCHRFNGVESLGIPAVDLATVRERIRWPWFQRLLNDPKSVGMNSRMPEMWQSVDTAFGRVQRSPVPGILGGDPARQVEAVWQYLSLGTSMPLPDGLLVPEREFELLPSDGPELCAVFLRGHTPRGLMVGLPEQVHYAWDLEHARPVWAWRGRFFNAEGTWRGRAGGLEGPPSPDAYEFPAEGALVCEPPQAPRARGWKLDAARRPVFEYALGDASIEESLEPVLRPGGAVLVRRVVVRRARLEAAGPVIRRSDGGALVFVEEAGAFVARAEWEVTP